MREIFVSNYLRKEARNALVTSLSWVVFALTFLVIGIATGATLIIMSGTAALVISGFIVTRRGRAFVTYRCGMRGERILRDHLREL